MSLHFWQFSLLIGVFLLLLSACSRSGNDDGPLRAERPPATSTPADGTSEQSGRQGNQKIPPPSTSSHSDLSEVAHRPVSAESLVDLSTEEQLGLVVLPVRDLRELALRLKPEIDEIPVVVNSVATEYEVGDQLDFWVHNIQSNTNALMTAELIHKTDVAYAWVEVDQPFDQELIVASVDRFSQQSYGAEVAFFGSEANPGIDNDRRIHILHAMGTGGGVAGYFSSADQYSHLANEFSNEKEMFYISLGWLNRSQDYEYYETVLAHEFQHMIHWANDRNEETWINEGLSEFAQEVAGYDSDTTFTGSFSNRPDTQLNTWNESDQSNAVHYGSAYLFVSYFAQRFGPELTKALVAHPANGMDGVDAVLREAGYDLNADTLFADWIVANYIDDPNALGQDGVYGYRKFTQREPVLERTYDRYPIEPLASTVNNYATDYILLKGDGSVTINFEGQTETRLANTDAYSGRLAWWGNRGDDSNSRLTRAFDLRQIDIGNLIEMEVAMWWNIEVDYDYGYVLASRDGQKWDILEGQLTTTDNPSGNSFGAAYTDKSIDPDGSSANSTQSAWVIERFNLSPYAGEEVFIRFEYVTDDAVNLSGWFIDDVRIPVLGYETDFEGETEGWESEGWLLTDNQLTQRWLVQILELEDNVLVNVHRPSIDSDGKASVEFGNLGDGRTAVLAISALAPVTTEPARYELRIE